MAYTKILVVHDRLDKSVAYAQNHNKTSLEAALDYALNPAKTEKPCYETTLNCDSLTAYAEMSDTKRRWGKEDRKRKGYHIIQSFSPGETTPEVAHAIGVELARQVLEDRYEVIVATHLDKAHLHNHIVFNSVSFVDGGMYRDTMTDYFKGVRETSDNICRQYGLSIIDPERKGKQYREWDDDRKGRPTVREMVRREIDVALATAYTYQGFLRELRQRGYEVKDGPKVKHTAIRPPGSIRFVRLDSLGAGYSEDALKARLCSVRQGKTSPKRQPTPRTPFLTAGRHYYVRGGIPRRRPRRLNGFQALCFKYLCLLQRNPPHRRAVDMREELTKFDRYQRQFRYLRQSHIETQAQLSMQYDAIQSEIDALTDRRKELYKRRRAGDDTVVPEIEDITRQLRPLRRELKLCVQIEGDSAKMKKAVDEVTISPQRPRPTKSKSQNKEVK